MSNFSSRFKHSCFHSELLYSPDIRDQVVSSFPSIILSLSGTPLFTRVRTKVFHDFRTWSNKAMVREVVWDLKVSNRWFCRARSMILIGRKHTRLEGGKSLCGQRHLVIDIRDIHDQLDVISKIIGHNSPKNVLCHIVSTPTIAVKNHGNASKSPVEYTLHGPCVKHRKR